MDKSRREPYPGVWLDYRRAVFLEEEGVLAVADLHLGYAWAQRFNGQMLPIQDIDPLLERLLDLCATYQPRVVALLGDIVHQAAPVHAISAEFEQLIETLAARRTVWMILGNHDRKLEKFTGTRGGVEFHEALLLGNKLLLHGHEEVADVARAGLVIMGHEHPAISLGDGIASSRFPCFLLGPKILILPAFSRFASGGNIAAGRFMSPVARGAHFERAIAICGSKLLPVPLRWGGR